MGSLETQLSSISGALIHFFWGSGLMIYVLIGAGLYFTARTMFVQIRYFPLMFKLIGEPAHTPYGVGGLQAFALGVAGRVGAGNIMGVAVAILNGGPGAVFWMWVMALLGMATTFCESLLAQLYKVKDGPIHFRGGAFYYIAGGLKSRFMGAATAVSMLLSFGFVLIMQHANVVSSVAVDSFNVDSITVSVILSLLVLVVVTGSRQRIFRVAYILSSIMILVYVGFTVMIVGQNIVEVPAMLSLIFTNAFTGKAAAGGALGTVISMGMRRGFLSNEAGMGSSPTMAAVASTSHPAKSALVQSLAVFTDTMIVCSATAFILILSGFHTADSAIDSDLVVTQTWLSHLSSLGQYIVIYSLFIFSFTGMIIAYFYGASSLVFLRKKEGVPLLFKLFVGFMVFLGPLITGTLAWELIDIFLAITGLINIYALIRLFPVVQLVLKDFETQVKTGFNPVFQGSSIAGLEVECWSDEAAHAFYNNKQFKHHNFR